MGYTNTNTNTYTPTYYSSLQDSITSICKTILPFSFKKPRLAASKHQTDNLKWQQNSYHKILNLMGLHKEGLLSESEVSAFRTHLLDTLIASNGVQHEHEQPPILRDKLIFLQELLYAKCISAEEYHASKRPLLQRLAVQGAEIEARNVIVGTQKDETLEEEWSVIDLRDEQTLLKKENSSSKNKKSKYGTSAMKHIKDAASVLGLGSSHKQKSIFDLPADNTEISKNGDGEFGGNPFWNNNRKKENESDPNSILLMSEDLGANSDKFGNDKGCCGTDKGKKKAFLGLFHRDEEKEAEKPQEIESKSARKQWGIDGFKRWKRNEKETTPLHHPTERCSSGEGALKETSQLVSSPVGQDSDTKHTKTKLLSDGLQSSGFYIDKVLGDKIKKELARIQTELSHTNPNFRFSNDQMDVISTKLPVDKGDLKQFFPKSWCDRYGDVVLDVVKKEFKDHVGEMENMRNATLERRYNNSKRWTTFEDVENSHPNLLAAQNQTFPLKQQSFFTS